MRHLNSNQKDGIDNLSKGVKSNLVREEESFTAKNTEGFNVGPVAQTFIVEWQMPSNEAVEFNKKSAREIETGIYLH